MSRAVQGTPTGSCMTGDDSRASASSHRSQADVVPEQEMHAEHVAALETTLFRKRKPTLVLSLESGRFRVLSKSDDRREALEN